MRPRRYALIMRGTKWFCIVLGCLLVACTILPAPFGLVLQSAASSGVQSKMQEMFKDGSLSVDSQKLEAKHASDRGGPGPDYHYRSPEDAQSAAAIIVLWSVVDRLSGLGMQVALGKFVLGLLWIGVGIRIPAKLPTSPPAPA
jgi:hypothetical protein